MEPTYNFPVLRGIQAGREYYTTMCPMKLVPKLFLYDEVSVPAELRSQRILNKARIPDITNYIVEHPKEYVFSAITASIDASVEFQPIGNNPEDQNIGQLTIPMDATFIINDGQHRRAAIEEALKKRPELGDESIAVVFFIDAGLKWSQQMFADLNKHAVRPSQSLGVLYDHRNPLSELTREIVASIPIFRKLTEKEKTSISNRSPKLFTLSALHQATQALLRKKTKDPVSEAEINLAISFWQEVCKVIPEWNQALLKEVSCAMLRENFIHSHGVALQALGYAGADLLSHHPDDWQQFIKKLSSIDWSRNNIEVWEGRAMLQGKISKANRHVNLTGILIKQHLGLPLSIEEEKLEETFMSGEIDLR